MGDSRACNGAQFPYANLSQKRQQVWAAVEVQLEKQMIRRQVSALFLTTFLFAAACSKGVSRDTVAVVNGEDVSLAELNSELKAANVSESANRTQLERQVLSRIINRKLLAQADTERGIDETPEFVVRRQKLSDELLITLLTELEADVLPNPSPLEVEQFIASHPAMFNERAVLSVNQIQFEPPTNMAALAPLRDDRTLEEVAASLTGLNIPFERSAAKFDTATLPPELVTKIKKLAPGEPFVLPSAGRILVSTIVAREAAPVAPEQQRNIAKEAFRAQKAGDAMRTRLGELRAKAKVEYKPGYEAPASP
jgi:EpsD family peptidyl-prolyl cis-trans isomerase